MHPDDLTDAELDELAAALEDHPDVSALIADAARPLTPEELRREAELEAVQAEVDRRARVRAILADEAVAAAAQRFTDTIAAAAEKRAELNTLLAARRQAQAGDVLATIIIGAGLFVSTGMIVLVLAAVWRAIR